jgi:hypothetical protein
MKTIVPQSVIDELRKKGVQASMEFSELFRRSNELNAELKQVGIKLDRALLEIQRLAEYIQSLTTEDNEIKPPKSYLTPREVFEVFNPATASDDSLNEYEGGTVAVELDKIANADIKSPEEHTPSEP